MGQICYGPALLLAELSSYHSERCGAGSDVAGIMILVFLMIKFVEVTLVWKRIAAIVDYVAAGNTPC